MCEVNNTEKKRQLLVETFDWHQRGGLKAFPHQFIGLGLTAAAAVSTAHTQLWMRTMTLVDVNVLFGDFLQ